MEDDSSVFEILTGKPIGKRSLGRPSARYDDIIRKDLKDIGINTKNLVDLAEDRDYWRVLVNVGLNLWIP